MTSFANHAYTEFTNEQSQSVKESFMNTSSSDRMIFFTDIDETLLNTDKSLSPENMDALDRFLAMDNIICVSTGRALDGAAIALRKLGLYGRKNLLISSYNGGHVFDTYEEKTSSLCVMRLYRRGAVSGGRLTGITGLTECRIIPGSIL